MKMLSCVLVLGLPLVSMNALAQEGAELLKSKGCVMCHTPDQKKAGPSMKDIAAKHKDAKEAQAGIVAELKAPKKHPKVKPSSDAELNTMVSYMLTGK